MFPPPGPILIGSPPPQATEEIVCVNVEDRAPGGPNVIDLRTRYDGNFIELYNSGDLTAESNSVSASGIYTQTVGPNSNIVVENRGDIIAYGFGATGISAFAYDVGSGVRIENSGQIDVFGIVSRAVAIQGAKTYGDNSIVIVNTGKLAAESMGGSAWGIRADVNRGGDSRIEILNSGDVEVITDTYAAQGIDAQAGRLSPRTPILIQNFGNLHVQRVTDAVGIAG